MTLSLLYKPQSTFNAAADVPVPCTAPIGKPIPDSPAAAEAAYVHAIIHRQEGQCIGEFGSGFSNANYWYR